jgi:hypothetical protein
MYFYHAHDLSIPDASAHLPAKNPPFHINADLNISSVNRPKNPPIAEAAAVSSPACPKPSLTKPSLTAPLLSPALPPSTQTPPTPP